MEKLTIKDIILAASGKDEKGFNKSACGLFYEKVDLEGNATIISEIDVDRPIINIFKGNKRVQVDIVYAMKNDIDLRMMNDLLVRAFSAENSIDDTATSVPLVTLSIIPRELEGQFFILCSDPIVWCLTAQDPRGEIDTLRFVFDEEDFNIMAASEEALEMLDIELEEDLAEEEKTAAFYEEKATEEKAKRYEF